jgi:hypothetical protein
VLSFLKDKPEQVSGVDEEKRPFLYEKFRSALKVHHPDIVTAFDEKMRARDEKKSAWAMVMNKGSDQRTEFQFSFGT